MFLGSVLRCYSETLRLLKKVILGNTDIATEGTEVLLRGTDVLLEALRLLLEVLLMY